MNTGLYSCTFVEDRKTMVGGQVVNSYELGPKRRRIAVVGSDNGARLSRERQLHPRRAPAEMREATRGEDVE